MKKLLFDLRCAQPSIDSKFHGGGEYTKTLFDKMVCDHHKKDVEVYAIIDSKRFLDEWLKELIKEHDVASFDVPNGSDIKSVINVDEYDIYYLGIAAPHGLENSKITKVCTAHDLRDYEEPVDKFSYKYYDRFSEVLKQVVKYKAIKKIRSRNLNRYKADILSYDKFITVSYHTEYMVKSSMPEVANIQNGTFYTPSKHLEEPKPIEGFNEENFILLVSANRWIKNAYRAILAIDNLYSKGIITEKTVLVGKISNRMSKQIVNKDKFINLDYLDTPQLEYLYSKCKLFAYPTLNEGFGMPPLEVMRYGKTCLISGLCSLPELYADTAYYINPYKIEEIEGRITMALRNPISQEKIKERYNYITSKQEADLAKACDFIVGK
ncbi:MAG: glycosyltransferase [Lachnospiraceae bacterium]|nr:glycosyltransferase [Lachnospiraceae bacterium]